MFTRTVTVCGTWATTHSLPPYPQICLTRSSRPEISTIFERTLKLNFPIVFQSISHVWLFATPWTEACQASLSFTVSQSLLKLMSTESVMPSNHLNLCHPLRFLPSTFPSIRGLFQWVSSSHQVAKVLEFQLQHQSFQWIFRTDFL